MENKKYKGCRKERKHMKILITVDTPDVENYIKFLLLICKIEESRKIPSVQDTRIDT